MVHVNFGSINSAVKYSKSFDVRLNDPNDGEHI